MGASSVRFCAREVDLPSICVSVLLPSVYLLLLLLLDCREGDILLAAAVCGVYVCSCSMKRSHMVRFVLPIQCFSISTSL
jgi:hypothetical protein